MAEQLATLIDEGPDEAFKERLQLVIKRIGTAEEAADRIGFSAEQLAKWRDGKARPPLRPIANLCAMTGASLDWLVFGAPLERHHLRPEDEQWVAVTPNEHRTLHALNDVAFVPLLDVVASAGPGVENPLPFEIARLPFPKTWLERLGVPAKDARFIDSRGDSMEPTIPDGAICLVDTRVEQARKDGIYVLVDGANVRIKRIAIGWQNSIVLISDNERYASETLAPPDAEALRVAGKVVWAGGEI